jgi:hypothetical protein
MPLPSFAAWRHVQASTGFEVVFIAAPAFEGSTTAVEEGEPFAVRYAIELDDGWRTRSARVWGRSREGEREIALETDGHGEWRVDGRPAPHLSGCLDVDLESSSLTNAFPVNRMRLAIGEAAEAPAAYVRALDLAVERLEQRYERIGESRYAYASPAFGFACELAYGDDGLVLDYPGIATRHAAG